MAFHGPKSTYVSNNYQFHLKPQTLKILCQKYEIYDCPEEEVVSYDFVCTCMM